MALIRQRVNIHKFPAVENVPLGARIVMGDLHANAVTLLLMLVKEGIASNITSSQYDEFVQLSEKGGDALSAEDLRRFYQIIDYLIIRKGISILLLGDEVVDRAENPDLFPVEVIVKLVKNDVVLTILVSNHGIELLDRSEKRRPFSETELPLPYSNSAHQLQKLIDRGLVDREEFEHTLDNFYKPCLKIIAYSYGADKTFFLYSHARIGLGQVVDMATEFDCVYPGGGIAILAREIDCINDKFQTYLKNRQAHLLYDYERLGHTSGAIDFAIWNRDRKNLDRPETLYGYKLTFVHGHDRRDKDKDPVHVINLDGLLGKEPHLNEEEYSILVQFTQGIADADDASCNTGRKLLSWEGEEDDVSFVQTSAAARLSAWPTFFPIVKAGLGLISSYWEPVKLPKAISRETSYTPPPVPTPSIQPTVRCEPILYGEDRLPALQCGNDNFNVHIFLKESTTTAVSTQTASCSAEPTGLKADTYGLSECQPVEHFGLPSIHCEGEQTNFIYTPQIEPDLFARLDGNLMLGGVIWNLAKQGYAWLTGTVEDDSNQLAAEDLIHINTDDISNTFDKLKKKLCYIEQLIYKQGINKEFLLAKNEIQLRLTELEAEVQVSESSLKEIELDILCLEEDLDAELNSVVTTYLSTEVIGQKREDMKNLHTLGLFAVSKAIHPGSTMKPSYENRTKAVVTQRLLN